MVITTRRQYRAQAAAEQQANNPAYTPTGDPAALSEEDTPPRDQAPAPAPKRRRFRIINRNRDKPANTANHQMRIRIKVPGLSRREKRERERERERRVRSLMNISQLVENPAKKVMVTGPDGVTTEYHSKDVVIGAMQLLQMSGRYATADIMAWANIQPRREDHEDHEDSYDSQATISAPPTPRPSSSPSPGPMPATPRLAPMPDHEVDSLFEPLINSMALQNAHTYK